MNEITRPDDPDSRCGFVAIVGRPNVGKSTLLNHILGQKLSITSRKPQTTRHQVLGIKTDGPVQAIYVDTPGMHEEEPRALNRYMNRAASSALVDVDVVVFVVDQLAWTPADELVLDKLSRVRCPVILAVNKVDKLANREQLLPHIEMLSKKREFAEIIPLSALKETNLAPLEAAVGRFLPKSVHFYPDDQITDRSERFLASEIVREKITRQLGAEVPYSVAVEIEQFKHEGKTLHIAALILVEREGQKKIIIGDKGARLRRIGQEARLDMERLFGSKVMLRLWVKVKRGWADSERALRSLGMDSH
ncbi:GTPase Era [Marinobacter lutaoensis]|jgi:GTP-binding protein Era|uniref:GTPase Era n=1 Tax=Marinobacter lutaoensis TaxID=135739 RepID=A0A1V2DQB4_9GAMM|nr:GTPase Era [Marinobacter lutaoensis]MBE01654.1 GTPase Era [Marinobacter sp.]MBI43002.1 GTPase Era [Oceanospirillales bacterium]NVD34618.1 GTPase Era [Marinobacter lutaoensis]ONF42845.1 GTPase Era [Marinobacter lutaoensis]|tara:strand:+ start:5104 stop:6021 length:918 start_codon:yes stop_codon:yes gene_type:complete